MLDHIPSNQSTELVKHSTSIDNDISSDNKNENDTNGNCKQFYSKIPIENENCLIDTQENFNPTLANVELLVKSLSFLETLPNLSQSPPNNNHLYEHVRIRPLEIDSSSSIEIERDKDRQVYYRRFSGESDLQPVIDLITKDLSEPYSIYTYRYFIYNWPRMCIMAFSFDGRCIGAVVGKTETHAAAVTVSMVTTERTRGYIAMLAVQKEFRRRQIGSRLVELVVDTMVEDGCSEVVLETEITNKSALSLYEKLGFIRDKRLFRYYLNGVDAFRLKLWMS